MSSSYDRASPMSRSSISGPKALSVNKKLESISETEYQAKMAALSERKLLMWAVKVCFIPCFLISVLATFFPYPQAVVPVHESQYCICYFLGKKGSRTFLLFDVETSDVDVIILKVINVIMFFGLNWLFLLMIILSVYHVRHIRDRLEIRREMTLIVVFWSFCCLLQYIWYLTAQISSDNCHSGKIEST